MADVPTEANRRGRTRVTDPSTAILHAADACYARYGITKTTMEDVAREAGLSRPTVYRYYATRGDLIAGVVTLRVHQIFDRTKNFIDTLPTIDAKIVDGLVYHVDAGRRDPMVFQMVSLEFMDVATSVELPRLIIDLTAEFWAPILEDARKSGQILADFDVQRFCVWLTFVELVIADRLDHARSDQIAIKRDIERFVVPALHRRGPLRIPGMVSSLDASAEERT